MRVKSKNELLVLPAPGPAGDGRYTSVVIPQIGDDGRFVQLRQSFDLLKRLGRMESTLAALTARCPMRVMLYEARSTSKTTDYDVVEIYGGETRDIGRRSSERST
jgi:hypothetical protein